MAFLFIGGEQEDFTPSGGATSLSGTAFNRSAYSRGVVYVPGNTFPAVYHKASFAASSTINVTARFYYSNTSTAGQAFLWLATGGSPRLRVKAVSTSATTTTLAIDTYTSGGTATTLATSTLTVTISTVYKVDLLVSYGTSGRVRLYIDGVLYIDYTGDVTASGATTLDGLFLGACSSSSSFNTFWSEVVVTDSEDTRPLSVKTLAPNAAGDTTAWTSGAYTDIDEIPASDLDVAISETAAQIFTVNCTGMPTGASNLSVRAVKSVALACRGSSGGPTKLDMGLRQSSTNAFAASQTLDTGFGAFSATWTTNPITSAVFTPTEIDNLQLAYRSAT